MNFDQLIKLIEDDINISWWKMLFIGSFFLLINLGIFVAMWYTRRGIIIEYGFPKRNRKSIKKKISNYSIIEKIILIRLSREAERKGFFLYLTLACHLLSVLSYFSCLIGFVGCMITLADGWALTMLVISQLASLFVTVLIEFIPQLIWLPSERRRYKL